jgi:hypothetical protein
MIKFEGKQMINIQINDHKLCSESTFPYTNFVIYKVELETKLKSWSIYRRFKNFEALHTELKKKYLNLPVFPEKKFFNLSEETINQRKRILTEYLNYFLQKTNFSVNSALLEFLELDKEFLLILIKFPSAILSRSASQKRILDKEELVRKAKSKEKEKDYFNFFNKGKNLFNDLDESSILERLNYNLIDDLLNNLESSREDMCENINKFWLHLKEQENWPRFSTSDLIKLFFGNHEEIEQNGLIYYSGRVRENVLGAEACLSLICKMLDYETNPECEKCVNVFRMARTEHLQMMNLERHLKCNKPIVLNNALKLMKLVSMGEKPIDIYTIIKDPVNIDKYIHYISE